MAMFNSTEILPGILPKLPAPFANLQIYIELGKAILSIVSEVGKILLDRPESESAELIGLKAELGAKEGIKPADFENMDDYLNCLNEKVKVDEKMLDSLSDVERYKYQVLGAGLYIVGMEQKFNIGLPANFWKTAVTVGLAANDIANLITGFASEKLSDAGAFERYLRGDLQPGSSERTIVYHATDNMLHKKFPELDDAGIDEKLETMKSDLKA
jgi:hypothetical protein